MSHVLSIQVCYLYNLVNHIAQNLPLVPLCNATPITSTHHRLSSNTPLNSMLLSNE